MLENNKTRTALTDYDNFVKLSALYRNASNQTCENPSWEDSIALMKNPKKDPANNMRPWTYQTCNEFGYFQTANSTAHPFYNWTKWLTGDFYMDICREAFDGWKSKPMVDWMNQIYGDTRIAGTNIIFPSGTIDPWHVLGVTNTTNLTNPSMKSAFIEGTAHCHDLYAESNSDPAALTKARKDISETIANWLK